MLTNDLANLGRGQSLLLRARVVAEDNVLALPVQEGEAGHLVQDIYADVHVIVQRRSERPEPLPVYGHQAEGAVQDVAPKPTLLASSDRSRCVRTRGIVVSGDPGCACALELHMGPQLAL